MAGKGGKGSAAKGVDGLTDRQRRFVACYKGNVIQAAIEAGYTEASARSQSATLLKHPIIGKLIYARQAKLAEALAKKHEDALLAEIGAIHTFGADRASVMGFWAEVMNNLGEHTPTRLRASENIAKALGMVSEKRVIEGGDKPVEHTHNGLVRVSLEDRIAAITEPEAALARLLE